MTPHLTRRTVLLRRITDKCALQRWRGIQRKWRIWSSHFFREQNFPLVIWKAAAWSIMPPSLPHSLSPSQPPTFHFVPWIYNLFNAASKSCVATWKSPFHFFSPSRIPDCAPKSFYQWKVRRTNSSLRFVNVVSLFICRCPESDIWPHACKMLHIGRRQWSIC
jgi:hypothetical protein